MVFMNGFLQGSCIANISYFMILLSLRRLAITLSLDFIVLYCNIDSVGCLLILVGGGFQEV